MIKIKTYIKDPKAKKTSIFIIASYQGHRVRLFPGISIDPVHFLKDKTISTKDTEHLKKNKALKDYIEKVEKIFQEQVDKGILPDLNYFKDRFEAKPIDDSNFWEAWSDRMEKKEKDYNVLTVKKWNALKYHLKKFEAKAGALVLDNINASTLTKFENYLFSDKKTAKKVKRGLNRASAAKYIRLFKTHLIWCYDNDYTKNEDWRKYKAKRKTSIKQEPITLNEKDIKKIEALDLGNKNYLKNVRDLLMISIATCLRFSDYTTIKEQHLNVFGRYLEKVTVKTKKAVKIPLTDKTVLRIQRLIKGEVYTISNPKMNLYVKELCQLAGIDEPIEVLDTRGGGNPKIITKKKYELISTHTGRRSGASIYAKRGMPLKVICQLTGHTSIKQLQEYIGYDVETAMDIMRGYIEEKPIMKVNKEAI
jgi:site-specific recombinase XerD